MNSEIFNYLFFFFIKLFFLKKKEFNLTFIKE